MHILLEASDSRAPFASVSLRSDVILKNTFFDEAVKLFLLPYHEQMFAEDTRLSLRLEKQKTKLNTEH